MNLKNKILNIFKKQNLRSYKLFIKNNYNDLYQEILLQTKYLNQFKHIKFSQRLYHIVNDINDISFCQKKDCNNVVKFISFKFGYRKHCCRKCQDNDKEFHRKKVENIKNNIDENGLNSYQRSGRKISITLMLKSKEEWFEINRKRKETNDIIYGDENYNNSDKRIKTQRNNIDKNGLNGLQRISLKVIETKFNDIDKNGLNGLQRSGIKSRETWNNKSKEEICEIIKKRKETNDIIYGDENYNNINQMIKTNNNLHGGLLFGSDKISEKIKEYNLEKFGVKYYTQTKHFKELYKDEMFIYNRELKKIETCNERYNCDYYTQTKEWAEKQYWTKKQKRKIIHTIHRNKRMNFMKFY